MTFNLQPPRLSWPFPRRHVRERVDAPIVEPLTPAAARGLRLPWNSRYSAEGLARYIAGWPGWGWVVPQTGEWLVAEGWRHRDDVAIINEVHARRHRAELVRGAAGGLARLGVRTLLVPDLEWHLHGRTYGQEGFMRLERIVHYQLTGLRLPLDLQRPLPPLQIVPINRNNLAAVVEVDHASFPHLWRNSAGEFASYLSIPGVRVVLALADGQPVAYAGTTATGHWGHLDRIGVADWAQGRGYGAALLAYILAQLARQGVTRVTLSTQETNVQSQRLYKGFGFRQTNEVYSIYGKLLEPPGATGGRPPGP